MHKGAAAVLHITGEAQPGVFEPTGLGDGGGHSTDTRGWHRPKTEQVAPPMGPRMKALDHDACRAFLRAHRVGTMALAKGGEAYAFPLYYAFDGDALFFHSRRGRKEEFLDATTRACFLVVDVKSDDDWTSVQARGRVERVATNTDADRAFQAIAENPFPPAFGLNFAGQPRRSGKDAFLWMMRPDEVAGRESRPLVGLLP